MPEAVKLSFQCNENIEQMQKCNLGFFCSSCKKTVIDYRKTNIDSFHQKLKEYENVSTCGLYKSYQIGSEKGDWRDKIYASYRTLLMRKSKLNMVPIAIMSMFVFIVSCGNRQTAGAYAYHNLGTDKARISSKAMINDLSSPTKEGMLPSKQR